MDNVVNQWTNRFPYSSPPALLFKYCLIYTPLLFLISTSLHTHIPPYIPIQKSPRFPFDPHTLPCKPSFSTVSSHLLFLLTSSLFPPPLSSHLLSLPISSLPTSYLFSPPISSHLLSLPTSSLPTSYLFSPPLSSHLLSLPISSLPTSYLFSPPISSHLLSLPTSSLPTSYLFSPPLSSHLLSIIYQAQINMEIYTSPPPGLHTSPPLPQPPTLVSYSLCTIRTSSSIHYI